MGVNKPHQGKFIKDRRYWCEVSKYDELRYQYEEEDFYYFIPVNMDPWIRNGWLSGGYVCFFKYTHTWYEGSNFKFGK